MMPCAGKLPCSTTMNYLCFYETGLHPVFFGETIIGEKLPQLTYMLTFKDMEERDANWKKVCRSSGVEANVIPT